MSAPSSRLSKAHSGRDAELGLETVSKTEPLLKQLSTPRGQVLSTPTGWELSIPPGPANAYRLAQLDNYTGLNRRDFLSRPPFRLMLKARISRAVATGTWGFGMWNDPFGLAFNPMGNRLILPTGPQAAWFIWASPASYLSLRDDLPANGMMAQSFRSASVWRWVAQTAIALPVKRAVARAFMRRHIAEDSRLVHANLQAWHEYEIRWDAACVSYLVDGCQILKTNISPRPPLGVVIWIDNQFARFDPSGRLGWGFEATNGDCKLEIRNPRVSS